MGNNKETPFLPKIWGDVSEAAVGLGQLRNLRLTSDIDEFRRCDNTSGYAKQAGEFSSVFVAIPKQKEYSPIYYANTRVQFTRNGKSFDGIHNCIGYTLKQSPKFSRAAFLYGGDKANHASCYNFEPNTTYGRVSYYLGNGRFFYNIDTGVHLFRLDHPNDNMAANIYSAPVGDFVYTFSTSVYQMAHIANPETPLYSGFNSGLGAAISFQTTPFMSGLAYGVYKTGCYVPTWMGTIAGGAEPVFVYASLGLDTRGHGCGLVATISTKIGAKVNGLPDTEFRLMVVLDDGSYGYASRVSVPTPFSHTPTYKYIGDAVSLGHGKAIVLVGTGGPSLTYYMEAAISVDNVVLGYKFFAGNSYAAANYIEDTLGGGNGNTSALLSATGWNLETPNIPTKDLVKLYVLMTANYGETWSFHNIDVSSLINYPPPYVMVNGVYANDGGITGYVSTSDFDFSETPAARFNDKCFNANSIFYGEEEKASIQRFSIGSLPDFFVFSITKSSRFCVIDKDTILWFYNPYYIEREPPTSGDGGITEYYKLNSKQYKCYVSRSVDGGKTWTRLDGFPEEPRIIFNQDYAYAPKGSSSYGFYKDVWEATGAYPWIGQCRVEDFLCLRPGVALLKLCKYWIQDAPVGVASSNVLAAMGQLKKPDPYVLFLTTDYGDTWKRITPVGIPYPASENALSLSNIVLLSVNSNEQGGKKSKIGVYAYNGSDNCDDFLVSEDDGKTWTKLHSAIHPSYDDPVNRGFSGVTDCGFSANFVVTNSNTYKGYVYPTSDKDTNIWYVGENFEAPADIALPWRLDARVPMPE